MNSIPSRSISTTFGVGDSISYAQLLDVRSKGVRNGNWVLLELSEKALLRCALWVAKVRGGIRNLQLLTQVMKIIPKLLQSISSVGKAGRVRAIKMFEKYNIPTGVFSWAPIVKEWLQDPGYIRYLGIMQVNT